MPIIKKDEPTPQRPIIIVIYGVPGSGKTSVATTSCTPLIIDVDRGADRAVQRADTLMTNNWNDVLAEQNAGTFNSYKTIVVDTARAMLDDYLSTYVCEQDYKLTRNTLKRFGAMADSFKLFVNNLRNAGSDIIFICHDKEVQEGDVIKHSPDCTGQSKDLLLRIADQVGYISFENGKRVISFQPTDNYVSKNVAGLDKKIIPDYGSKEFETFMAEIITAVKTNIQGRSEAQRAANELLAKLREELSKADDEAKIAKLMEDCKPLPRLLKSPFFEEVKTTLKGKGFDYEVQKDAQGKTISAKFVKTTTDGDKAKPTDKAGK